MAVSTEQAWHSGEDFMHSLMKVPHQPNPTSDSLTPSAAFRVNRSPLIAVGTLDDKGRPWTAIWGNEAGFAQPLRIQSNDGTPATAIGFRCTIDGKFDPTLEAVKAAWEAKAENEGEEKKVSGLSIDLMSRSRVKWAGSVVGLLANPDEGSEDVADMQMIVKVESSLGNCPKYLNQKTLHVEKPKPVRHDLSATGPLPPEAASIIENADLFFLTSCNSDNSHFSTNHRGGPKGFIRVVPATTPDAPLQIAYPEYSGNRLYQTLGNLHNNPRAGLVIPNFHTGDVLYATASARILAADEAAALLPRSNLAVLFTVEEAFWVAAGLGMRSPAADADEPGTPSPYNPPVRYLTSERAPAGAGQAESAPAGTATLTARDILSPTLARFTFTLDATNPSKPLTWQPGQHVSLSFAPELGAGYSHMRDDDPASLNDDLVRTFTVSSRPGTSGLSGQEEMQLTLRNVGRCTGFLFGANPRAGLELPVLGFAGEFRVGSGGGSGGGDGEAKGEDQAVVGFVAGGIGITPLLAQLEDLNRQRLVLLWGVSGKDVAAAAALAGIWRGGAEAEGLGWVRLFVSGEVSAEGEQELEKLRGWGVLVERRRLVKDDFLAEETKGVKTWYLCAGKAVTAAVEGWVGELGKDVRSESFDY